MGLNICILKQSSNNGGMLNNLIVIGRLFCLELSDENSCGSRCRSTNIVDVAQAVHGHKHINTCIYIYVILCTYNIFSINSGSYNSETYFIILLYYNVL